MCDARGRVEIIMTYENPNSAGQGGMQSETSPADMRAAQAATPATAEPVESLDKGNEMARGLNNRHVQFIAIGGTIGTGLFLGSGKSIALTGPSIIFVYIGVGLIMFLLMRAIGEMMYRDPSQHTFINFITRYLGRGWGKFAGWTYWIVLILTGMTEITAVSTYFVTFFGMFDINLKAWKWLIELCFLVALTCVNLIAVKVFGEAEFWFSMIKITLIVGLIATAVVMLVIGFHYPATHIEGVDGTIAGATVSLRNLVNGFQIAPNGWMSFFMSFQMVFFAYLLIEFVGVTVSETQNPRKVLPKAVNEIIMRILIFYVGALVAIMCIVPWRNFHQNADGSFGSPFIMVFKYAGLDWAAALVFFVVITAAASSLNSLLYSAGRHLYQLAQDSDVALGGSVGPQGAREGDRGVRLYDPAVTDHQRAARHLQRIRAVLIGRQRRGDLHLRADDVRAPRLPEERRLSCRRLPDAGLEGDGLDCDRVLRVRIRHVVPVGRHHRLRDCRCGLVGGVRRLLSVA